MLRRIGSAPGALGADCPKLALCVWHLAIVSPFEGTQSASGTHHRRRLRVHFTPRLGSNGMRGPISMQGFGKVHDRAAQISCRTWSRGIPIVQIRTSLEFVM